LDQVGVGYSTLPLGEFVTVVTLSGSGGVTSSKGLYCSDWEWRGSLAR